MFDNENLNRVNRINKLLVQVSEFKKTLQVSVQLLRAKRKEFEDKGLGKISAVDSLDKCEWRIGLLNEALDWVIADGLKDIEKELEK